MQSKIFAVLVVFLVVVVSVAAAFAADVETTNPAGDGVAAPATDSGGTMSMATGGPAGGALYVVQSTTEPVFGVRVTPGQKDVVLAVVYFDAFASGEDVKITQIRMTVIPVHAQANELENPRWYDRSTGELLEPDYQSGFDNPNPNSPDSADHLFTANPIIIPAGKTRSGIFRVNVANTVSEGDTFRIRITDVTCRGMTTGENIHERYHVNYDNVIAVVVPTLNINLAPETPASQIIVLGGNIYTGSVWELQSNKDMTVNTLPIETINGGYDEVNFVSLWDERGEMIARKLAINNRVVFENLNLRCAAYLPRQLWLKLETGRTLPHGPATPGKNDNFTIDFNGVVATTDDGQPVKVVGSGTPPVMFFYRSAISVSWEPVPSAVRHLPDQTLGRVKVTADASGGTAVLKGLLFRYTSTKSCPGAVFYPEWVEGNIPRLEVVVDLQYEGEGDFVVNDLGLGIQPGMSQTIDLTGTLPTFVNRPGTFSVRLVGIEWQEAPGGILLNGGLVPGVPTPPNIFQFVGEEPVPPTPVPSVDLPNEVYWTRSSDRDEAFVPVQIIGGEVWGGKLTFRFPDILSVKWGMVGLATSRREVGKLTVVFSSTGTPIAGDFGEFRFGNFPQGEGDYAITCESSLCTSLGPPEKWTPSQTEKMVIHVQYGMNVTVSPAEFWVPEMPLVVIENGTPPFTFTFPIPTGISVMKNPGGEYRLFFTPDYFVPDYLDGDKVQSSVIVRDSRGANREAPFIIHIRFGDVTIDGSITIADAILILQYIGWLEFNPYQLTVGDYNRDGHVGFKDVIELVNDILGITDGGGSAAGSAKILIDKDEVKARAEAALAELEGDDSPEAEMLREMIYGILKEHGISLPVFEDAPPSLPGGYRLHQSYPNPFNPQTTISYELPTAGEVILTITNALGQLVATPVDFHQEAGSHLVVWNAGDLAGGIYFYRLETNRFTKTRKMLLVR